VKRLQDVCTTTVLDISHDRPVLANYRVRCGGPPGARTRHLGIKRFCSAISDGWRQISARRIQPLEQADPRAETRLGGFENELDHGSHPDGLSGTPSRDLRSNPGRGPNGVTPRDNIADLYYTDFHDEWGPDPGGQAASRPDAS